MNDRRTEKPLTSKRLNVLGTGSTLLTIFLISVLLLGAGAVYLIMTMGFKEALKENWGWLIVIILVENILFWVGIIMVYVTSVQLGMKMRIIGILCGLIPIVHIIVLIMIISITGSEARFEKKKLKLDRQRHDQQICRTKYPLLMVQGVFLRYFK